MFSGLSAFPLTPLNETAIDEAAFVRLVERLAVSGVDSICALGSTGSYAYLSRTERARVPCSTNWTWPEVARFVGIVWVSACDGGVIWHSNRYCFLMIWQWEKNSTARNII